MRFIRSHLFILLLQVICRSSLALSPMSRTKLLRGVAGALATGFSLLTRPSESFSAPIPTSSKYDMKLSSTKDVSDVAYRSFSISLEDFGAQVPVACWFPVNGNQALEDIQTVSYPHRISVRRIGQLLAGWDFIPEFLSRDFKLDPIWGGAILDGSTLDIPSKCPVVVLAHGYLGSRFDLSHLGEKLASEGFVCVSPEFPESLAASYDRVDGLDRSRITDKLLKSLEDWKISPSRFGIVGHSLGCGTAMQTGDDSWTRVLIAGFPKNRDGTPLPGNLLFLASMGDGLFNSPRNALGKDIVSSDYSKLEEGVTVDKIPRRAALIYDGVNAPNHISFLAPSVNDAMINLLSPLLPVAQAASLPVLDFDRYKDSRDAIQTAEVVHPLILQYLKQEMLGK